MLKQRNSIFSYLVAPLSTYRQAVIIQIYKSSSKIQTCFFIILYYAK